MKCYLNINKMRVLLFLILLGGSVSILNSESIGATENSQKTLLFENKKVRVWKTVMEPNQSLGFHRHPTARVEVSLTSGDVEVKTQSGKSKKVQVKKDTSYWRDANPEGELHSDTNISDHPLEFIVVEMLEEKVDS